MSRSRIQMILHLAAICAIAFTLRHTGWNWDEGQSLHPDERHMVMVTLALDQNDHWLTDFDTKKSTMNPYNQGVNSYVYGLLPLKILHHFTVAKGETSFQGITRAGRFFSALWSTGTVALLYLFGLRLVSARCAAFASLLLAFTVLSIQQAHFYTVDSAGVFFSTLCVGLGLIGLKERKNGYLLLAAATVGLAMACRLNLGLLAFWITAVSIASAIKQKNVSPLLFLLGGGILSICCFRFFQTNAFDSSGIIPSGLNRQWLRDLDQVRQISLGTLEVPFTLQWVGKIPYLYALQQMVLTGFGFPAGMLALGGSAWLLWQNRLHPGNWPLLLALWPCLLIGYHGRIFLHTLRYFLPAYPLLLLGGAVALRKVPKKKVKWILQGVVLFGTAFYALAFLNMYREPHPRVQASKWLYENLPVGGNVVSEHWDDSLPLRLPGKEERHRKISFQQLEVYQPESPEKTRAILQTLENAPYFVLSSTRASLTIPKMPLRYPVMTKFYQMLTEESSPAGFKEVARFHRQPNLWGWRQQSLQAEEAYRVYDHPLVRIYQKTPDFDPEHLFDALTEDTDFAHIPQISYLKANKSNQGWLNPGEMDPEAEMKKWSERFPAESVGNQNPVFIWGFILWFLGPLGFPWLYFIFPNLRDRGWAISRLAGVLLLSFMAWWPSALGWISFDRSVIFSSMLFGSFSALIYGLHFEVLQKWFRRKWKLILWEEGILWMVFGAFLFLRYLQPDLWHPWAGGEKPMDFAYLNATVNTAFFPPQNPWLSGAFINYYYYGFVLFASLILLTGISPDIAYNLALPSCALFISGGAITLSSAFFPWFRSRKGWTGWKVSSLWTAGVVLFSGNLAQIREFLRPGNLSFFQQYWNASRAIQVPEGAVQPITEFPLFSLLYGDLHAHLIALPVAMLCLISSWQLLRHFHPARIFVSGILLGTVWVINTWDFPIQALIFLFCLFCAPLPSTGKILWIWRRSGWAILGLMLSKWAYAPFHFRQASYPAIFTPWTGPRSAPIDLLLAHGLFILPFTVGLWILFRSKSLREAPARARLLPLLLFTGSMGTVLFVEFFTLSGDIGRMNMVFKFYYQVWWILAVITGGIMVSAWNRGKMHQRLGFAFICISIGGLSLLYTFTAVPAKIQDRFWQTKQRGLDGLAYLEDAQWFNHEKAEWISLRSDEAGIEWLRKNARPGSVIMEAHLPEYHWGGRMSWHTGLPAVLGWNWHMRQQRPWPGGGDVVWRRAEDIQQFYMEATPGIPRKYGVDYIISGELERVTYGDRHQKLLDHSEAFQLVFKQPGIRIYQPAP